MILKSDEDFELKIEYMEQLYNDMCSKLSKIKITNDKTFNRLIEMAFSTENHFNSKAEKNAYSRCSRTLLKLLFRMDKERFIKNFLTQKMPEITEQKISSSKKRPITRQNSH